MRQVSYREKFGEFIPIEYLIILNTGQDRTGQDRTGQDRTGQDRTGHTKE